MDGINLISEILKGAKVTTERNSIDFLFGKDNNSLCEDKDEYYFDGNCMIPMQSWNAQMELEHWNRYKTFHYLADSKNVLDVACGEGYGTNLLSSIARSAVGIDISNKNISHANKKYADGRNNLKYIAADACNLPIKFNKIEVLYSFETIEHLGNIPAFLLSISRVISDSGVGIISTPRPNINPASHKPFNPYHINELSVTEFGNYLNEYFKFIAIAGQSKEFPYEIHREFDGNRDSYAIGIVSNSENAVKEIIRRLPDGKTLSIREQLFERHLNRARNFSKALRILFVPLTDTNCNNPADRRRILLPANYLRNYGAEIAVVNKEDVFNIRSDIICSQNRDYEYWLSNVDKLKKNNRRLVFTCSDAIGVSSQSKAHYFEAFLEKEKPQNIFSVNKHLKLFLEQCCSHVFAGSDEQRRIIFDIAPSVPISVLCDPIDTETYNADLITAKQFQANKKFTLIWEGFNDNMPYLLVCADAIKRLSRKIPLKVMVVTSNTRRNSFLGTSNNAELAGKILGDIAEFHVWDKATISQLMAQSDAALAPLFIDCQFAKAKPPNKVVIYNYMKLPVIASPTAAFKSYIKDYQNGFIANTEIDWEGYIEYLYENPVTRKEMGELGHKKAKDNFSLDVISKQMLDVFRKGA